MNIRHLIWSRYDLWTIGLISSWNISQRLGHQKYSGILMMYSEKKTLLSKTIQKLQKVFFEHYVSLFFLLKNKIFKNKTNIIFSLIIRNWHHYMTMRWSTIQNQLRFERWQTQKTLQNGHNSSLFCFDRNHFSVYSIFFANTINSEGPKNS